MESASESKTDLTTNINLGALRAVGDPLSSLLEKTTADEREVLSKLPEGSAMLMVLSGPSRGARFLLDSEATTIGRSPESDIFLDDVTVSRRHARISRVGKDFIFNDLGSLNGSYLDGKSFTEGKLTHGVELHIGKYRLHFFLGGKVK